jgi:hypothetical protein
MPVHLATICTNRKRPTVPPDLDIRNLKATPQEKLLHNWVQNVANSAERLPAERVYCGRGFQEALHTAAYLGTDLLIISAGVGLVSSKEPIPAYNATLANSSKSSIRLRAKGPYRTRRVRNGEGRESALPLVCMDGS